MVCDIVAIAASGFETDVQRVYMMEFEPGNEQVVALGSVVELSVNDVFVVVTQGNVEFMFGDVDAEDVVDDCPFAEDGWIKERWSLWQPSDTISPGIVAHLGIIGVESAQRLKIVS